MKYKTELDGQYWFWKKFQPFVAPRLTVEQLISRGTDDLVNGCLVECKLIIDDIFKVLFQTIKYCSKFRIEGKPVPANILLVSLNEGICYHYHSEDYLDDIEKIYNGQASKNNEGFIAQEPLRVFDYDHNDLDFNDMLDVMKKDKFTKVHVDLSNIIGLRNEYFKMRPMALKGEFIGEEEDGRLSLVGEIRKPAILHYIYPYEKKNNDEFKLVMDQLNAKFQKKDLGHIILHYLMLSL